MVVVQRNVISGQSKGCWLCVQVRYTRILFIRFWSKSDKQAKHIYLFAPKHNPNSGYSCTRIGLTLAIAAMMTFGIAASANAGNHYGISLAPGETLVSVDGVRCHSQAAVVVATPVRRVILRPVVRPFVWAIAPVKRILRCSSGTCR